MRRCTTVIPSAASPPVHSATATGLRSLIRRAICRPLCRAGSRMAPSFNRSTPTRLGPRERGPRNCRSIIHNVHWLLRVTPTRELLSHGASGLPEVELGLGIVLATLLALPHPFFPDRAPPRARPSVNQRPPAKRHRTTLRGRTGIAPERKPHAADHQCGEGLRHFHARRRWTDCELESRRTGDQRLRGRRSPGQACFDPLSCRPRPVNDGGA